jgi:signal transduction histidine kinase
MDRLDPSLGLTSRSPEASDARRVAREALTRAVQRVERDLQVSDALLAGRLRGELATLEEVIASTLESGLPPAQPTPDDPIRRKALDDLRAAVLRDWPDGAPQDALLELMRAIEAARGALVPSHPPLQAGESSLDPFARRLLREVAHLLRSPLGSVVMLADALAQGRLEEAQRKQTRIIGRAALSLASTAGDLLTATSEASELGSPQPFSLARVIEATAEVVRPITEERGVSLETGTLEGPDERLGHPRVLGRILANLAIHTALETRAGSLRVHARPSGTQEMVFEIVGATGSTGPDEVGRIFRASAEWNELSLAPRALGVAVARDLLLRLGSDLMVSDRDDRRTFSFRLALPDTRSRVSGSVASD